MAFQVGDLDNIQDDDPVFESQHKAKNAAAERSRYRDCAQGIWTSQAEGSEIIAIAYQGGLYYP